MVLKLHFLIITVVPIWIRGTLDEGKRIRMANWAGGQTMAIPEFFNELLHKTSLGFNLWEITMFNCAWKTSKTSKIEGQIIAVKQYFCECNIISLISHKGGKNQNIVLKKQASYNAWTMMRTHLIMYLLFLVEGCDVEIPPLKTVNFPFTLILGAWDALGALVDWKLTIR